MALERFAIVRLNEASGQIYRDEETGLFMTVDGQPRAHGSVVDIIEAETDPDSENREVVVDTPSHRFVPSDVAQPGWTWTEDGGLSAP